MEIEGEEAAKEERKMEKESMVKVEKGNRESGATKMGKVREKMEKEVRAKMAKGVRARMEKAKK